MFRWAKPNYKSTTSYEPKTPKINSISLPDERNTPIGYKPIYTERPSTRNSLLKRFSISDSRPTTPSRDSRHSIVGGVAPQSGFFVRTRSISASVREVEAPRPIRPHPSQGPFIPLSDQGDRVVINPSRGAPIEVPSAAFLEEKVERQKMPSVKAKAAPTNYMSNQQYQDGMRKRAEKASGSFNTAPSKAWFQDQEENAKRLSSVIPIIDDYNFKPIPVVNELPDMVKAPLNKPLKSALKKTPLVKKQELEPLFKAREYGDAKAYYSENDTDKRKRESARPYRVTKGPSKAYLEEQQEKLEDLMKQQEAAWHPQARARPTSVAKDFRPPPFQHSSSSGSPNESVLQKEYNRTRRVSNTDVPRPKLSNYKPAYVKDSRTPQQFPIVIEPHLEWPLVEYSRRRHLPEPLVYFDAGFDPREHRYEVCTVTRGHRVPLTTSQRNLVISTEKIVIKNESLKFWPTIIYPNTATRAIRVIDVFRAIYDTYGVPLNRDELASIGREYIQRCEPSFLQRCKDARESTHHLENQGMRRIDLLKGKRIFKGLVQHRGAPPHHFELLFDRGD